jgi:hypothetical protein
MSGFLCQFRYRYWTSFQKETVERGLKFLLPVKKKLILKVAGSEQTLIRRIFIQNLLLEKETILKRCLLVSRYFFNSSSPLKNLKYD